MSEGYAAGINSALRHHQAGRGGQSLSLLLQTVADHPNAFDAWFNLGVVQHLEGLLSAAGVSLQQAITLRPHSAEAHVALGLLFFDRHEVSSAFAEMDRALTLDPHNAETLAQKASMLRNSGDGEEAARYFRKAIQLQPHYGEAYHALASLRKQTRNETHLSRDVEGMEGAYQSSQTSPHDRMLIGFALGKVFDDLGEYDKAFGYFEQANRSQRQSFSYSTERQARFFRRHEEGLGRRSRNTVQARESMIRRPFSYWVCRGRGPVWSNRFSRVILLFLGLGKWNTPECLWRQWRKSPAAEKQRKLILRPGSQ